MTRISRKTIGGFFTTDGKDVWQHIVYFESPTATLVNLQTSEKRGGAIGSLILDEFKLLEVKEAIRE